MRPPPPIQVPPDDRRLPVPTAKPEPSRRSWQPLVLVAALVAGIAVAAAVVVATLPHGLGSPTAAASTGASAPAAAVPSSPARSSPARTTAAPSASAPAKPSGGAPPGNLRLQDNRDSVSLTWTYPKGAEGPVLISGGRTGQQQRAFQQLPAGTANYVVYGLNPQTNYCFAVAVVYTVDDVATSPQLCTKRR